MTTQMKKEFITKVIQRRNFHDIPDWMISQVDDVVFVDLYSTISSVIDENITLASLAGAQYCPTDGNLSNIISFLSKLGKCKTIKPSHIPQLLQPKFSFLGRDDFYILACLFQTEDDWKRFLHNYMNMVLECDLSAMGYLAFSRILTACKVYRYRFDKITPCMIDAMLKIIHAAMSDCEGDELVDHFFTNISFLEGYNYPEECVLHMANGNQFLDEVMDMVYKRARKYYWGDTIFSLENIWNYHCPYLPEKVDQQYLISYLWMMSSNPKIELSDRLTENINDVIRMHDDELTDIVFNSVMMMFADPTCVNANNIRFLMPFYWIEKYKEPIDKLVKELLDSGFFMVNHGIAFRSLRDYTYFYPKDMNNDEIQKKFLIQNEGDPTSLTSNKFGGDTYIHTADGVCCAILNCNPIYLVELLEDDKVCNILCEEIIGKVGFSPVIEKIVPVIEKGIVTSGHGNFNVLRMMITRHYPFVETALDVCLPLLRISRFTPVESSSITSRWMNAIFHISVCDQSDKQILKGIKGLCSDKNYIPLYFGIDKTKTGLEDVFKLSTMMEILKINCAYFADIRNDEIAELLYSRAYLWE